MCQEWLGITWMEASFILRVTCFRGSWGVIPALSVLVSLCKLIPVWNTQPKWLLESSWLVSCLARGLHFRTSGTALPVSATVCGKMGIWERNRNPLLCTSLKWCCKCRTFVSVALNIWVVTFKYVLLSGRWCEHSSHTEICLLYLCSCLHAEFLTCSCTSYIYICFTYNKRYYAGYSFLLW